MKFLQFALLFFIICITTTDASKKTQRVLKKVGKRFSLSEFGVVQRLDYMWRTAETVEAARNHSAELVARLLLSQSSADNLKFQESADILYSLMDNNFEGKICGGDETLNFYQMSDYWKRQRKTYRRNEKENVTWRAYPIEDNAYNKFMVRFNSKSTWGYSATMIYVVHMRLLGEKKYSNYTLTKIEEVGACTEYGGVSLENTNLYELDPERLETRDKLLKHLQELFYTEQKVSEIPFDWIYSSASEKELKIEVCHGTELKKMAKKDFIKWWEWFQMMCRPVKGENEHTLVQITGGVYDRLVFRVTMLVHVGTEDIHPTEEFSFKLQFKYDVHGDKEWLINKFEVMCPTIAVPEADLMKKHALVYREIIGSRLQLMVNNPELWYNFAEAIVALTSPTYEVENCAGKGEEMEKGTDMYQLKHTFWKLNKDTHGRMEGYTLGKKNDISETGEKMWARIRIIWTPGNDKLVYDSRWTFYLEWNSDLQAFTIYKMILQCPTVARIGEIKYYSSLNKPTTNTTSQ